MVSSSEFTTQAISFLTETAQGLQDFSSDSTIASSSRGDFDKVSIVPMPPLQQYERSPQQLNIFKSAEVAASVAIAPCSSCGSTQARQTAGRGPHYAGLRCGNCNRFLKWLPSPKPELSSNEGGAA